MSDMSSTTTTAVWEETWSSVSVPGLRVCGVMMLLVLSGTIQACNLSFVNQDVAELRCMQKDGSDGEKREAGAILPLRERHTHYMVAAFIVATTACDATTVLLLDSLTDSSVIAFCLSTVLLTLCCNMLPEALAFRFSSFVATRLAPLTYFVMLVTFPVAFPLSLCLDCCLRGPSDPVRNRQYLLAYVRIMLRESDNLSHTVTLTVQDKLVRQIMTPMDKVVSLSETDVLDWSHFVRILRSGFSRIPVHRQKDPHHIVGLLHVKEMALMFGIRNRTIRLPVRVLMGKSPRPINFVSADTALNRDSFVRSLKSGMHLVFVLSPTTPPHVIGIVTLEDMIDAVITSQVTADKIQAPSPTRHKGILYAKQLVKALQQHASPYNSPTA